MNGMRCAMSPLMKWTSREKSIELRDRDRVFAFPGHVESACQLRLKLEGFRSLACFDFGKFSDNLEPVRLRKAFQCLALGLKPKAQSLLP
jgi:hypothetical protein